MSPWIIEGGIVGIRRMHHAYLNIWRGDMRHRCGGLLLDIPFAKSFRDYYIPSSTCLSWVQARPRASRFIANKWITKWITLTISLSREIKTPTMIMLNIELIHDCVSYPQLSRGSVSAVTYLAKLFVYRSYKINHIVWQYKLNQCLLWNKIARKSNAWYVETLSDIMWAVRKHDARKFRPLSESCAFS